MALITKPNTFSAGAVIVASEHNSNFDTIYNDYNGNITNANVASGANIALSKLSLSDDATFTGDIALTNNATTDNILSITGNSLTTGYGLNISSSSADTSARTLVNVTNTSTAATGCVGVTINNVAGAHLRLTGDPTITATTAGDGGIWFDGSDFYGAVGTSAVKFQSNIVAVAYEQISSLVTCTTHIPFDDTIPQNDEGDEVVTCAITPVSSSNILKIEAVVNAGWPDNSIRNKGIAAALFQDSTVNALAVSSVMGYEFNETASKGIISNLKITYFMVAGTTSETTFKVRVGTNNASYNAYVNGYDGNRLFGGTEMSSITITEIQA